MKKKRMLWLGWIVIMGGQAVWWTLRSDSPIPPEPGVIDVWTTFGDDAESLQELFDEYELATGMEVRVSNQIRTEDLEEVLAKSETPDLVIFSGIDPVSSYSEQGLIESLDRWIGTAGIDIGDIYPAVLEQCMPIDGELLCLPWGCDIEVLFWNKDLFKAAGLDPDTPPQSLEQLLEYANQLTLRNEEGELIQAGFIPDLPRPHTDLYIQLLGGSHDKGGSSMQGERVSLTDETQTWLLQVNEIFHPDELGDFISSITPYTESSHPVLVGRRMSCHQCHRTTSLESKKLPDLGFFEGQVGMMIDGSWHLSRGVPREGEIGVQYGVASVPAPASHPDREYTTVVEGPVVVLPAGAIDKEAAVDLLAWMMSPELVAQVSINNASLPSSRSAAEDWRFRQSEIMEMLLDLLGHPNSSPQQSEPARLGSP